MFTAFPVQMQRQDLFTGKGQQSSLTRNIGSVHFGPEGKSDNTDDTDPVICNQSSAIR